MLKKILILPVLVLLGACASQSRIETNQVLTKSLKGYSTIAMVVTANSSSIDQKDFEKSKANLVEAVVTKLRARTSLHDVSDPATADLRLTVVITELHYVSQAARIFAGIMAGHATLKTEIELVDTKTGEKLWTASTDTASNESQGVAGSSSTTQLEALSEQIVSVIQTKI